MSRYFRTLVGEGLSTFFLVFLAAGAAVIGVAASVGVAGRWPGTLVTCAVLLLALLIMGVAAAVGPLARRHLSPEVTFALFRRRQVAGDAASDAWIAQAVGAA